MAFGKQRTVSVNFSSQIWLNFVGKIPTAIFCQTLSRQLFVWRIHFGEIHPSVNFINILRMHFVPIFLRQKLQSCVLCLNFVGTKI